MSWRVVSVASRAKLDYKMDYLVIRTQEDVRRIHLSEISVLVIESVGVSLTSYLLCELSKRKVDVIFCDEKRFPFAFMESFYGSHDTSRKVRIQMKWSEETKAGIWAEIIRHKIAGQQRILEINERKEAILLEKYAQEIMPGDSSNREGHAAKVYFNALFGKSFSRSDNNPVNAGLNYGYSIILSAIAREIVANGYITQVGLFHENVFNGFNLASDLIEPFRPFVDYKVLSMDIEEFGADERRSIINVLNRMVIISGKENYCLNAIRIYVKSVLDALGAEDVTLIRFPEYEFQIYESDSIF